MTDLEAAIAVLKEASGPLHYREIEVEADLREFLLEMHPRQRELLVGQRQRCHGPRTSWRTDDGSARPDHYKRGVDERRDR